MIVPSWVSAMLHGIGRSAHHTALPPPSASVSRHDTKDTHLLLEALRLLAARPAEEPTAQQRDTPRTWAKLFPTIFKRLLVADDEIELLV